MSTFFFDLMKNFLTMDFCSNSAVLFPQKHPLTFFREDLQVLACEISESLDRKLITFPENRAWQFHKLVHQIFILKLIWFPRKQYIFLATDIGSENMFLCQMSMFVISAKLGLFVIIWGSIWLKQYFYFNTYSGQWTMDLTCVTRAPTSPHLQPLSVMFTYLYDFIYFLFPEGKCGVRPDEPV